eukprot:4584897-Prymnesium_polylepis.1
MPSQLLARAGRRILDAVLDKMRCASLAFRTSNFHQAFRESPQQSSGEAGGLPSKRRAAEKRRVAASSFCVMLNLLVAAIPLLSASINHSCAVHGWVGGAAPGGSCKPPKRQRVTTSAAFALPSLCASQVWLPATAPRY